VEVTVQKRHKPGIFFQCKQTNFQCKQTNKSLDSTHSTENYGCRWARISLSRGSVLSREYFPSSYYLLQRSSDETWTVFMSPSRNVRRGRRKSRVAAMMKSCRASPSFCSRSPHCTRRLPAARPQQYDTIRNAIQRALKSSQESA